MNTERLYQIAFTLLPIQKAAEAKLLLESVESPSMLFTDKALQSNEWLAPCILAAIKSGELLKQADAILETCFKQNIEITFIDEERFPYRLAACPDSPLLLYSKGTLNLNTKQVISIVGTRKSTPRGREITDQLIVELSSQCPDLIIVSGLAYGIDVAAHRAALKQGLSTVAVLAHGLDHLYPQAHQNEAMALQQKGCLISELYPGIKPEGWRFLQRNRIVAGLSDACIVVESGVKGGSLNTATRAFEYDRVVFAVPGRPNDTQSAGCNTLIKDLKAHLLVNASDVLTELMWGLTKSSKPIQQRLFDSLPLNEQRLYDLMSESDGIPLNELIQRSGFSVSEVVATCVKMELDGSIESLPGSLYRTKRRVLN